MAKKETSKEEMTLEEARLYRASLYTTPKINLNLRQKRELFRVFWAKSRKKYIVKTEGLEKILWMHLLATKHDEPEKFEMGLQHFGLKKIG